MRLNVVLNSAAGQIGLSRFFAGKEKVEIADEGVRIDAVGKTTFFNIFKMCGHTAEARHPSH